MTKQNILFLDDDIIRTEKFLTNNHNESIVDTCSTARVCIALLNTYRYDVVHLDHDLGGERFVDSAREDCGMEVVRWLVQNRYGSFPSYCAKIIVHTHNDNAGAAMTTLLRAAGYEAKYIPFGYDKEIEV